MEFRGGRAESAPTLDGVEPYTEEWEEDLTQGECSEEQTGRKEGDKAVRFHKVVQVRAVAAAGKQKSISKVLRATWSTQKLPSFPNAVAALDAAEEEWRRATVEEGRQQAVDFKERHFSGKD